MSQSRQKTRPVLEQLLCTVTCFETYFAILKEIIVDSRSLLILSHAAI